MCRRAPPNTQTAILSLCRGPWIVCSPPGQLGADIECARSFKAVAGGASLGGDFAYIPISSWLEAAAAAGTPWRWEGWGKQRPWD